MSDERQLRALLARAAELPDEVQPTVRPLIEQGRRRRAVRTAATVLAAGVAAAAAFALPALLARPAATQPGPAGGGRHPSVVPPAPAGRPAASGPTARQLAGFRWSSLPPSPLGAVSDPLLTWTGSELIELGGFQHKTPSFQGAAYDPATRRWHRVAGVGAHVNPGGGGLAGAVTTWTGSALFVATGPSSPRCRGTACQAQASLYDPAANAWSSVTLPGQFDGLTPQSAVWTGRAIVLTAGAPNGGKLVVAAYYPATRRWTIITPRFPAGHLPAYAVLASTPGRLFLWSLWQQVHEHRHGFSIRSGVDVLALTPSGAWHTLAVRWPQHETISQPTLTGYGLLFSPGQIWCGDACSPPGVSTPGFLASPVTLARTPVPGGPLSQAEASYLWTGRALLAVDVYDEITGQHIHILPGDMAAWDTATGWQALPPPPDQASLAAPPVWTGSALLELASNGQLLSFSR